MKLFRYSVLASLLAMSFNGVVAQHKWTLDECIEFAIQNNIDIHRRIVDIECREIKLNTSKNAWLPGLSAEIGEQVSFCNYDFYTGHVEETSDDSKDLSYTTARIGMSMPLFNASRLKYNAKSDEYLLEAATENLEKAKKDIRIQVAVYYLDCLYRKNMVDVARSQMDVSRQLIDRSKVLVRDGKRPLSEEAEAEAQLANDEYMLAEAEGQYRLALLMLSQLLNLESPENFEVADLATDDIAMEALPSIDYYDAVVETFPSIRAAKAEIESGKAMIKVAQSALHPSISLQGYVGMFYAKMFNKDIIVDMSTYNFFKDNMNEVIGVHMSIPIFNRFESKNNVRLAKLGVTNLELEMNEARLKLHKEIQTAYYNADVAYDKLIAADKAVEASSISVGYEENRYNNGRSNIYDLQQAQQKHLKAQQNSVQAKYEYLIRRRVLKFYCE